MYKTSRPMHLPVPFAATPKSEVPAPKTPANYRPIFTPSGTNSVQSLPQVPSFPFAGSPRPLPLSPPSSQNSALQRALQNSLLPPGNCGDVPVQSSGVLQQ